MIKLESNSAGVFGVCWWRLVCVSTTRPGRTSAESQNTNRLSGPLTPPPTLRQQTITTQGWLAGKFYRNFKFDQTRENIYKAVIAAQVGTGGVQSASCEMQPG